MSSSVHGVLEKIGLKVTDTHIAMEKERFMHIIKIMRKVREQEQCEFDRMYGGDLGYRRRWMCGGKEIGTWLQVIG